MRFLFFFVLFCASLFADKPTVLVSLAPYSMLVEKIAKNTVEAQIIVPPNSDPHSFEPTLKSMEEIKKATIWFCIGELFEKKVKNVLKAQNNKIKIVDLSYMGKDKHFWFSIPILKQQAKIICDNLSEQYPHFAKTYKQNLSSFYTELDNLDADIKHILKDNPTKAILVTHPAFYYFCQTYGLKQISIEKYGKEPTLKDIEVIYEQAKNYKIKNIIIEPQHPKKGAQNIAQKLKIPTVLIDPYDKDFINSLKLLAHLIASNNNTSLGFDNL
jgi:zinc transport system substrate-binding protein